MLTQNSIISQIMILPDGQIHVQRADMILRDGVEIARIIHRHVINPGDDYSGEDVRVFEICRLVYTADVIEARLEARALSLDA